MKVVLTIVAVLALGVASRAGSGESPAMSPPSASADAGSRGDVEAWIGRLTGADATARKVAVAAADSATSALLPAISKRLSELKKSVNREAMGVVIARGRAAANGADDSLERAMAAPVPGDAGWRDAVTVLGLSRMLAHIATTPAVRELTGIYAGFGEIFRPDVERQVRALGEHSVATLIELRRGDPKPLRPWAAKLLDTLEKAVPGEAVQTADNQVLADVLRAYGRTKDSDAARVIVSFANSDRTQVREAAREAVTMLGDNGIWQLRESYENLMGKKPPEDWNWEKLASELFAAFDKARLSEVYALMDEGLAAQKNGNLDAMATAFDRVLARAPSFERRRDMVRGYIDFARSLERADRPRAITILRKAVRIDPSGPRAREAESELTYLEALELAGHGVIDETAYRRAVELDPGNARAREALGRIQTASDAASGSFVGYLIASVLGALACVGLALVWRGRR